MKVLKVNQEYFRWFTICPNDDTENRLIQMLQNLFGWFGVFTLASLFVSSLLWVWINPSTDLGEVLYATYPAIASFRVLVSIISMIIFHESAKSHGFFEKAEKLSNKIFKFSTIYFSLYFAIVTFLMGAISMLDCYITKGSVQADYLSVPYKFALPWNQHTIGGWMATTTYVAITASIYIFINSMILSFFIGIYLYFDAFYQKFAILINEVNSPAIEIENLDEQPAPTELQRKKEIHAKQMLREIIQFDIIAKELFSIAAKIFDATAFFLVFCTVGYMSINIFILESAIRNMKLSIVLLFLDVLIALSDPVIFCYCGAMTTDIFAKYVDRFYEVHWYDLPVPLQKHLIIIIANLQRPFDYRGFGMVTLNLVTFFNIIKAVSSYYLAFKTLND